jgi:probable phosphoglycerate mutase
MATMTELILIRHGETDWNVERRLQGHLDVALNAEGERQAAAVAAALAAEQVHAVYASDMQRAQLTAQAIAAPRGMQVLTDPALRERCYGDLQGLTHEEISVRYPQDYAAWHAREPDVRYASQQAVAETLREFSARAVGAVIALATQAAAGSDPKKIVIVTHGGVLDCVHRHAASHGLQQPRNFDLLNASINRLSWDGRSLQIRQWGEAAHLAQPALDEIER